jgi:hypothetical protein
MKDAQGFSPIESAARKGNWEAEKILQAGPLKEQSEYSKKLLAHFKKGKKLDFLNFWKLLKYYFLVFFGIIFQFFEFLNFLQVKMKLCANC